jgi:hypothetical protein
MTLRRRAALQAVVWGGYVAVSLAMLAGFQTVTGSLLFVMVALGALLWVASEGLRALALRQAWLDGSTRALVLRLVFVTPAAALGVQLTLFAVNAAGLALGWLSFPGNLPQGVGVLFGYTINTTIMLWLWMSVWLGVQTLNRWRLGEIAEWRAETAARELELQVLRAQINPHFLFNALNNLRALINEDPARAREMVSRLSNTLRHTLQHSARPRVPLVDELAVVRDYVALEQLHHEERLQVTWQVDPASNGASLPPMLLQLLVENAIKHGIARTPGGGVVGVDIARDGPLLRIAVDNPGEWQPGQPGRTDSTGLGLANLRERLQRAGGEGADCRIESSAGRVKVSVQLSA